MTKTLKKELFESRLLLYIAEDSSIKNDYDTLAVLLSDKTGKKVNGRTINFMVKGESYAKKWMLTALLDVSFNMGWMPDTVSDWEHLIWTLTGKKQSVFGGDNTIVYQQLAELSNKPEILFENNFNEIISQVSI